MLLPVRLCTISQAFERSGHALPLSTRVASKSFLRCAVGGVLIPFALLFFSNWLDRAAQEPLLIGAAGVAADEQLRILDGDAAVGGDGMREPDIPANDAMVADAGVAAENRRAGINGDTVFNVGMALVRQTAHQPALGIALAGGIESPEGHAVIEGHVLPNGGRLSNHDARAVIDEKGFVDGGAGMNVNSGMAVGNFGHDAGQVWNF